MTREPKQLFSATYLAELLEVDRETIHRALKRGRLEPPSAILTVGGTAKPIAAWSETQVERVKANWAPGKPGRPRKTPPTPPPGRGRKRH
jgi:hypothetical protein